MKILHALDHSVPIHSGYSYRTLSILKAQRARGWDTCHVTGIRQHECTDGLDTVDGLRFRRTGPAPWQSVPLLRYVGMVRQMMLELRRAIDEEAPDVIHAHSPSLDALAALWARRGTGLPLVYEVRAFWEDAGVDHGTVAERGLRYRAIRALESFVLRRADAVTTICEGLRDDIVARGIPAERVTVIPNAVDAHRFEFDAAPDPDIAARFGLEGRPVIGFIGSFYAYEGLDLLIDAMPAVLEKRPDAVLLLVGGAEQEAALRERATGLGMGDSVIFAGRVPHDEVARWYSVIDVLAYPRRSMRLTETVTPLKPLEALAFGKLMALSDVGGHREIAGPAYADAAFPAGDVGALAARLVERIDAAGAVGTADATRAAGRGYVERERNWTASVARYARVYESLRPVADAGVATA